MPISVARRAGNGAGSTVGYAAVQIAIQKGARVIATAGETYADALHAVGAEVTITATAWLSE